MIERRPFALLGGADHGWLKAKHHFSFGDYFDPHRLELGDIRVWNDDEIAPNTGFPLHPHADMEIVTFVRSGAITHEDSLGNKGRTVAGDVQVMTAGSGVHHAEYNREDIVTRLFQIWIQTHTKGGQPSWGTRTFPKGRNAGKFVILASGFGEAEALPIRAHARVMAATLKPDEKITLQVAPERHIYLVPSKGNITVNGIRINARDGAAITDETELEFVSLDEAEIILVDAD